jgi:hypothetical protein
MLKIKVRAGRLGSNFERGAGSAAASEGGSRAEVTAGGKEEVP